MTQIIRLKQPAATHMPGAAPSLPRGLVLAALALACAALTLPAAAAEFDEADIFYEFNSTDRDLGAQVSLDGESWKLLQIWDPLGRELLEVAPKGGLRQVGLTELFFEGSEPSLAEVPFSQFRQLVPPGTYVFRGRTVDNVPLRSTDILSTDIPCPAVIAAPLEDVPVAVDAVVVRWRWLDGVINPDTERCNRMLPVELVAFEVIVEVVNEQVGLSRSVSFELPASARSVPIPREFLERGASLPATEFAIEVLAIEDTGNKTITSSSFEIADWGGGAASPQMANGRRRLRRPFSFGIRGSIDPC
jgi:hypothetical protein